MGKKSFIILFAIVSIVKIYTGLEYWLLMTLVTNKALQTIAAIIYDTLNHSLNAVTVLFIISILVSIVINLIITKIIYIILKGIASIELAGSGSGGTYSDRTYSGSDRTYSGSDRTYSGSDRTYSGSGGTYSDRTYSGSNNANNIDFKNVMDSWNAPAREFNDRYNRQREEFNERQRQMERDREIEDRAREARNREKQNW